MPDVSIVNRAVEAAPKDYTLPGSQELLLKAVSAVVDGSSAAAAFLPALQLLSPAGDVMWTSVNRSLPVAAGGSATMSWFLGGGIDGSEPPPSTATGTISDIASPGGTLTVTAPTGPTTSLDLAPTAVSAGTYGDATHVSEITVDADGRVTNAVSVAISGSGGAGGLIVLYDSGYLASSQASIDTGAGGIAPGHFALIIVGYLRSTGVVGSDNILMTFNNDSSALYDLNRLQNAGTTVTGASVALRTSLNIGNMPGTTMHANIFGSFVCDVPAYDGTSNYKSGIARSGTVDAVAANSVTAVSPFTYQSAAAISRLQIVCGTGGASFAAGSRLIVYGTQ